ncbi:HugZ family protein [Rhizobium sp. FKY42]|uniref:HugZ family pyridoxamine 5'-phosphate oxidase n=1 Tax=Rhizobium sp. FKY42 TaxID=2562310 RepID=UPI0010C04416|nr:HugZ family protein [Rhizobium sp. FKY42]
MNEKTSVLRPTDDEARQLARRLISEAPHVALSVLEPTTGWPSISRTIIALDEDGVPFILVSALAAHTGALKTDGRCSFLAGEPGRGDPLAHPRLSVQAQAQQIAREHPYFSALRDRFLNRHPKAQLYIDLPDFCFFRLMPQSGSLNGGFGKAFRLEGQDLVGRA